MHLKLDKLSIQNYSASDPPVISLGATWIHLWHGCSKGRKNRTEPKERSNQEGKKSSSKGRKARRIDHPKAKRLPGMPAPLRTVLRHAAKLRPASALWFSERPTNIPLREYFSPELEDRRGNKKLAPGFFLSLSPTSIPLGCKIWDFSSCGLCMDAILQTNATWRVCLSHSNTIVLVLEFCWSTKHAMIFFKWIPRR